MYIKLHLILISKNYIGSRKVDISKLYNIVYSGSGVEFFVRVEESSSERKYWFSWNNKHVLDVENIKYVYAYTQTLKSGNYKDNITYFKRILLDKQVLNVNMR